MGVKMRENRVVSVEDNTNRAFDISLEPFPHQLSLDVRLILTIETFSLSPFYSVSIKLHHVAYLTLTEESFLQAELLSDSPRHFVTS